MPSICLIRGGSDAQFIMGGCGFVIIIVLLCLLSIFSFAWLIVVSLHRLILIKSHIKVLNRVVYGSFEYEEQLSLTIHHHPIIVIASYTNLLLLC